MTSDATKLGVDSFTSPNTIISTDFNSIDTISQFLDMHTDPCSLFLNAIKTSQTREKYNRRFKIFLTFLKIPGNTMKDRCIFLAEKGKTNNQWISNCIIAYIIYRKDRIEKSHYRYMEDNLPSPKNL